MAKTTMTLSGFKWVNGKLADGLVALPYETPYSTPKEQKEDTKLEKPIKYRLGAPVELKAFLEMVKAYQKLAFNNLHHLKDGLDNEDDHTEKISAADKIALKYPAGFDISKTSILRILSQEDVEGFRIYFALPYGNGEVSITIQGIDKNRKPVKLKTILGAIDNDGRISDHSKFHPQNEEQVTPVEQLFLIEFLKNEILNKNRSNLLEEKNFKDFVKELFNFLQNQ